MRRVSAALALAIALVAFASPAYAWIAAENISNRNDYACNPRAVVDSLNNVHVVWFGGPDTALWQVYYQKFNGASWSAPVALSGSGASFPAIAIDADNNLHVVWHQGSNPEEVYYRKCTAGVWGATVNLSTSGTRSLYPRIAVDSSGNNIFVAWHEAGMNSGNWDIAAKKCTNGVWGGIENISNDSTLSRNVDLAVDAGGSFHIVWEDTDTARINYRKRDAGGALGSVVRMDASSSNNYNSAVCVSPNGNVHVAWHDNSPGDYEIYYRYFNGTAWSGITNISAQPVVVDCFVGIASDSNNNIHFAWGDYSTLYYKHQKTGGGLSSLVRLYSNKSKIPCVAFTNSGRCNILWMDNNTGWNVMWTYQNVPDVSPPAPVANFASTASDGQVKLEWTNPGDIDYTGTRIVWKTDSYPTGPADGSLLCDRAGTAGMIDSFTHIGLTNGTAYYYSAFSYDADTNYSTPAQTAGTPTLPPKSNLLLNGTMDAFTDGVATGWTAYKVNDPGNAISFAGDTMSISPGRIPSGGVSQGIFGIAGTSLPANGLTAAGIYRVISGLTPGKVYQFVGYPDLWNSAYSGDGQRYLINFGINTNGGNNPGTPTIDGSIGGCKWMTPDQALWNSASGSSVKFSSTHRATASFSAASSSVSVWAGLTIDNAAVKDAAATRFSIDQCYLFEWDFPVNLGLINGGFEGPRLDLQDGGDVIPSGWVPAGGGTGEWNDWRTDVYSKMSGGYGMCIANRRGACNAGMMQKIVCNQGYAQTFSAWAKTKGDDGTVASVGIDPYGGGDITSPNIVWVDSEPSITAWTHLSVTATSQSSAITVFIKTANSSFDTDAYHWSYFDDCTYSYAGPAVFGSISGFVRDNGGYAVSGAAVTAGAYSTTSAVDGSYTLVNIIPDTYSITAAKADYDSQIISEIVVSSAQNTAANFSLIPITRTIMEAKALADTRPLAVLEGVVTAVLPGMFYIGKGDEPLGVRVNWSGSSVAAGDKLSISGVMDTISGERCISARKITRNSSGNNTYPPLGMANRAVGGASSLGLQQGVREGSGPNNIGVLTRTWGRVGETGPGYFYINDGSTGGVKVYWAGSISAPYAVVTGISACEIPAGESVPVRVIRGTEVQD